eukprot:TRINITY_DN12889_c0_g2_i1.p1 TRINITY_DN12889_c0_g2~~TRINITY_DN12889_c0_g2_i1.p1  ORF type:complete len:173 (-),score=30.12 TRINITY_DN12889_c0_g2_i1:372-890(-)
MSVVTLKQVENTWKVGELAVVYSRSAENWVGATVVDILDGSWVRVEYLADDDLISKDMHVESPHLRPAPPLDGHTDCGEEQAPEAFGIAPQGVGVGRRQRPRTPAGCTFSFGGTEQLTCNFGNFKHGEASLGRPANDDPRWARGNSLADTAYSFGAPQGGSFRQRPMPWSRR